MKTPAPVLDILPHRLSAAQVHRMRLIPHREDEDLLYCYGDQPLSQHTQQQWEVVIGKRLHCTPLATAAFEALLSRHFYHPTPTDQQLRLSEDFLDRVIQTAHSIRSSDIHFEVFETHAQARFRLDGKLKTFYQIDKKEYPALINKIKIKAQLDIAEKRLPQDGRIGLKTAQDNPLDLRVSTLPTLHGEKLVLRLLNQHAQQLSLPELGFNPKALAHYRKHLKNSHGLILISGPTGSGKTTTLYATLNEINQPTTNILTIEDPIEYTLEGINQVQLKEAIGLSFPKALRTFLRQDPDIIMVGEIRDRDTAEMALRAALTGHLVLATLHSNSAWGIISRLRDMGIAPSLLLETLRLCVAQRLVRQLCPQCSQTSTAFPPELSPPKKLKTHRSAKGCNHCYHTGYKGRTALYELLPVTTALKKAVCEHPTDQARFHTQHPYATLREQAWEKVTAGHTSIQEVYPLIAF